MKTLMLGNEAAARGLYEAGCSFVSSYPGTPSTEITECAAKYPEIYAEWAPNEKVAMEAAFGASLAGYRSFCGMKHVGLNVAADPLFTLSYTGVRGGLVIGVEGLHIALGHGGRTVAAQENHDHSDDHRKGGCADQNKFQRGFLGGGDLRFPGGSGFFCFFGGGDDIRIVDGDVLGRGSGEVVVLHLFLLLILNYVYSL